MDFYKIIDNATDLVLNVAQQKDLIYIRNNNGGLVAFKDASKFSPCGVLIGPKTYMLEDLKDQIPNLDFPVVTMRKIGLKEYNQLKMALESQQEDQGNLPPVQEETLSDFSTLNTIKNSKILEMKQECNSKIINGVEIILSDESIHHFELTTEDQLNLQNIKYLISQGEVQFAYHSKGEPFRYYSKKDMLLIINTANEHILYHNSYFNSLKNYINSLTDIKDVNSIKYGQDFPNKYKSEVLLSFA